MRATGSFSAWCIRGIVLIALALFPLRAAAQLTSDQVPRQRTVPAEEGLKEEIDRSLFRLGPLRLLPTVRVNNAGYDNNVFGNPEGEPKTADWSANVTAGLRFVAPIGKKMYVAGDALPQYIWYRELADRRTLGGVYSAALLGFFNRMSLRVGGYGSRTFGFVSTETETQVIEDAQDGSANLEIEMTRKFSAYAGGEFRRARLHPGGPVPSLFVDVHQLDRDEGVVRGGLRYRITPDLDVTAGVEESQAKFVETPEQRNNRSTAYLLGLHFNRPRFYVNLNGGHREGRPYQGSIFPAYNANTYSYFLSYFLTRKLELQGFGNRGVSYGSILTGDIAEGNLYYVETRNGGGLNLQLHPRILIRGQAEYGTNAFPFPVSVGGELRSRTDKLTIYGGGFSVRVYRKVVFTASVDHFHYDSPFPNLTRTVIRYTTGLTFEGDLAR
jgi:hypothetical protein